MKDFFRYLTSSNEDQEWGIHLTVVGKYHAVPESVYPSKEHPTGYYFDYKAGRTLNEYQLNYISEGSGVFEIEEKTYQIQPGTMMIIGPGQNHRYKPDPTTGWTENYIGFKGTLSDHFIQRSLNQIKEPIVHLGSQLEIFDTYQKIQDLVQLQPPAYQQMASGHILNLLGQISSASRQKNFDSKRTEDLINSAKSFMWERVEATLDLKIFCQQQNISYSHFRKTFKEYTGIAPHQFFLDLKIMRARELILSSQLSITEITYQLGFESIHYFSRLFKKKTGVSPRDLRKK